MKNIINLVIGWIATLSIYIWGGWDIAIQSLLLFIVLDYITGILKAIYLKKLNSEIGYKGIVKKVLYLIVVAVSVVVDEMVGDTGTIRNIVVYFFAANEGLSILENCALMNLPLPQKLIDTLEQLKESEEE